MSTYVSHCLRTKILAVEGFGLAKYQLMTPSTIIMVSLDLIPFNYIVFDLTVSKNGGGDSFSQ